MAIDYSGLFRSSSDIRQERIDEINAQNAQMRTMGGSMAGLLGQVAAGRGAQIAEGLAGMFGLQTPEEIEADKAAQAMAEIEAEPGTPEYYSELAVAMQEIDPAKAMEVADHGKKLAEERERLNFERRRVENMELQTEVQQEQFAMTFEQQRAQFAANHELAKQQFQLSTDEFAFRKQQFQAGHDLAVDQFEFSKDQWKDQSPMRKAQLNQLALSAAETELRLAGETLDYNQKIAYDNIVSSVSFIPDQENAYVKYSERVAHKLNAMGMGAQAEKWFAQAEEARKGQLGSAFRPVVTQIEGVNENGQAGTWLYVNGSKQEFVPKGGSGDIPEEYSSTAEKQMRDSTTASFEAQGYADKVDGLYSRIEAFPDSEFSSGIRGKIENDVKNFLGVQDEEWSLNVEIRNIRNKAAILNLPKGPASDKDVELVLSGEIPDFTNKEQALKYLRGIQKVNQKVANYHADRAAWVTQYGNDGGFVQNQRIKMARTSLKGVKPEAMELYNQLVAERGQEYADTQFNAEYGFRPGEMMDTLDQDTRFLQSMNRRAN